MPVLGSEGWNLKYPWEGAMQEGRFRVELYNLSYSAFIFMGEKPGVGGTNHFREPCANSLTAPSFL